MLLEILLYSTIETSFANPFSIKPRLDIEAYIDINAVELGRESVRTILQIIKDHKEGKTVCYRQLIDHTITKL